MQTEESIEIENVEGNVESIRKEEEIQISEIEYFEAIKNYLVDKKYPNSFTKSQKRTLRKTTNCSYKLQDGKLKKKVKLFGKECWASVVFDKNERKTIFAEAHQSLLGGHCGKTKTINKIREQFYWPHLSKDVLKWHTHCDNCQREAQAPVVKKPKERLKPIATNAVWEFVGIDLIGPLSTTVSGNSFILTCTDLFSKWPIACAIPDKDAITVAQSIMQIFTTFGFPKFVLNDNRKEFLNEVMDTIHEPLGKERRMTTVYQPQSNGQAGHSNKALKMKLQKLVNENLSNWDELIPGVLFSMRVERNSSTKFSPFQLMFPGRSPTNLETSGIPFVSKV